MKLRSERTEYSLSAEAVDSFSEKLVALLKTLKYESRDVSRIRLSVEELLLRWLDEFGEGQPVTLTVRKRFGFCFISLELIGKEYNPLSLCGVTDKLFEDMRHEPRYSYRNGKNVVSLSVQKQKSSTILKLLLLFAAAVVAGLLTNAVLPESAHDVFLNGYLVPFYNMLSGIFTAVAVPMVFLSTIWGIVGIGDIATFQKVGKKMLLRFLLIMTLMCAAVSLVCLPIFRTQLAAGGANLGGIQAFYQMLLDIIPGSVFEPFVSGNTLQIIVIAVFVGIGLLVLGDRVSDLTAVIDQAHALELYILDVVNKIVPLFSFIVIYYLVISEQILSVLGMWKIVLIAVTAPLLFTAVYCLICKTRLKVPMKKLIPSLIPTFLITLSTDSSNAAYSECLNACTEKLGISSKITGFGIPVGFIVFKTGVASFVIPAAFYCAEVYGLDCSVVWIVVMVIVAVLLTVALPSVPGSGFLLLSSFLPAIGAPVEAIAPLLALFAVADFPLTAFKMPHLMMELTLQANNADLLDRDVLRQMPKNR